MVCAAVRAYGRCGVGGNGVRHRTYGLAVYELSARYNQGLDTGYDWGVRCAEAWPSNARTLRMKSTIGFYGGAGSVTGANFLFDTGSAKILIDCGTNAQEKVCAIANYESFGYNVASVDALVVTHAHADHIGRIPRLVRE